MFASPKMFCQNVVVAYRDIRCAHGVHLTHECSSNHTRIGKYNTQQDDATGVLKQNLTPRGTRRIQTFEIALPNPLIRPQTFMPVRHPPTPLHRIALMISTPKLRTSRLLSARAISMYRGLHITNAYLLHQSNRHPTKHTYHTSIPQTAYPADFPFLHSSPWCSDLVHAKCKSYPQNADPN